jgi:hypothetical protein
MFDRFPTRNRKCAHRISLGRRDSRKGGALIEFVFILPIMFLVILGSVDICNNIFVKQFMTEVSYQGVMKGVDAGMTESDLVSSINAHLAARNIGNATISIEGLDGSAFDDVLRGEMFEVLISLAGADRQDSPVIVQSIDLEARSVGVRQ